LGPTVDLIPILAPDGNTIHLTVVPTLVEFTHYDDPGPMIITVPGVNSNGVAATIVTQPPIPHFRVQQATVNAIVWEGQTVVLCGLESGHLQRMKNKVPILGDLPVVGRLFRSETNALAKKNLLIFVTPTIVDPAGNRLHSEEK
jgi:general secretion pathway protein D